MDAPIESKSEPRAAADDNHDDGANEAAGVGDDAESVVSSELSDRDTSAAFSLASRPVTPSFENEPRELGLSTPGWFSEFSDYDVITVHGLRDNHSTVWKSESGSLWLRDRLFAGRSVRQLDFIYAIDDSARVFQPDGIEVESRNLLRLYAEHRSCLPDALVEASQAVLPSDFENVETWERIKEARGQIAKLSTTMIFLGCPHKAESVDVLEDELHTLMTLPGPSIESGLIRKIKNIARQVEDTNARFLESRLLSRLAHASIFSLDPVEDPQATKDEKPTGNAALETDEPEPNQNGVRDENTAAASEEKPTFAAGGIPQPGGDDDSAAPGAGTDTKDAESPSVPAETEEDTRAQDEVPRPAFAELPAIRGTPFSRYTSCMYSTFEVHSRWRQNLIEHAALARGDEGMNESDSWIHDTRGLFDTPSYSMLGLVELHHPLFAD
ncbi:hypothetical protein LX36DRAFT_591731 [Colletotrichum falcatum]|nr:hypothetical protein LX36DRAFT_591731 [Colletotrichum falcatum]